MSDDTTRFGRAGDDRLDRAIDRAVRTMMHAEPRPGFRRRVLSRLEAPAERGSMLPRLAFGTIALAGVVLAVFLVRSGEQREAGPAPRTAAVQTPVASPSPQLSTPPRTTAPVDTPERDRRSARTSEAIPMPRVANIFGPPTGRVSSATTARTAEPGVPAGVRESSAATNIDTSDMPGVAPLRIAPIEIPPIQIAPIAPPK